jgi:hypothetical protein
VGYVLAAYAIVIGSVIAYVLHLARSRAALRKSLFADGKSNHG